MAAKIATVRAKAVTFTGNDARLGAKVTTLPTNDVTVIANAATYAAKIPSVAAKLTTLFRKVATLVRTVTTVAGRVVSQGATVVGSGVPHYPVVSLATRVQDSNVKVTTFVRSMATPIG